MTLPLGAELEAAAWFWLTDAQSRLDAEEQIRIAFNRVRWHESVVVSHPKLSVLEVGDPRVPDPPAGLPTQSGLRLLYGEATVIGHAPERDAVLGQPFLATLTKDDVTLLRAITSNTWARENPGKPALTIDEMDAAIEMLGPDMARTAILAGRA